ncbi:MAG: PqqD family protein [Erysipelotrichaceae bacterium]|nr:PqqD family protein [Erysipelotrichaceae bacterium]
MKYISRKGVILCEIADQNVLIAAKHLRKDVPYVTSLNETGAFCWKQLEEGIDEKELCQRMKQEYDVDQQDNISEDVHSLIQQLLERNYIQVMEK